MDSDRAEEGKVLQTPVTPHLNCGLWCGTVAAVGVGGSVGVFAAAVEPRLVWFPGRHRHQQRCISRHDRSRFNTTTFTCTYTQTQPERERPLPDWLGEPLVSHVC